MKYKFYMLEAEYDYLLHEFEKGKFPILFCGESCSKEDCLTLMKMHEERISKFGEQPTRIITTTGEGK